MQQRASAEQVAWIGERYRTYRLARAFGKEGGVSAVEGAGIEGFLRWLSGERMAWVWGEYRAYRLEPGVHVAQTEWIEAFLRWVEAGDETASASD